MQDDSNINTKQKNIKPKDINPIEHIILSGGGFLGFSYTGVFQYLEENKCLSDVKSATGCSIGAIYSLLLVLGYTSNNIKSLLTNLVFKNYLKIDGTSVINFFKLKGLENGQKMGELIKSLIKSKIDNENATFLECYEKTKIQLNIGVTNLTTNQFQLLNYLNKPHLPVHIAISASIAIPIVFEPIIIDNELFCDGGLLENLPIETALESCISISATTTNTTNIENGSENTNAIYKPTILAVYIYNIRSEIVNASNYKSNTMLDYMALLMNTLSSHYIFKKQQYNDEIVKYKNADVKLVSIQIPSNIMSILKLDATSKDIEETINIGYTSMKTEIDNW